MVVKSTNITELLEIMAHLRHPDKGCPWDLKQDFYSLIPYTIEEAYEVADAIERNDFDDLCSELGDLLLQVIFYSQLAQEQNVFDFEQVTQTLIDKLVNRHPHVFGDAVFSNDEERQQAWEQAKINERKSKSPEKESVLSGVAKNLPALVRCEKIQDKAANHGFDWPTVEPVFDKVLEELDEVKEAWQSGDQAHVQEEVGDLLLVSVNLARHLNVKPETALNQANQKFINRFHYIEQQLQIAGKKIEETELVELDRLWDEAKKHLKSE